LHTIDARTISYKSSPLYILTKSAERSIIPYINEHEEVVKIDSNIYSQGEGSDSPECF